MQQKAGAQIGKKAFLQSIIILFVLMLTAGILTRIIPAGKYTRVFEGEREMIDPNSFQLIEPPEYPIWRWFTAPLEVLAAPGSLTIIVIILFILMVGAAFAVLDRSAILRSVIARVVHWFGGRKYLLLMVISFFFMSLGAFFGIFEEVVPLIPLMLALSYYLGWDALVGLGMSILAVNMGFSAAITNPFTIGVAQKIAGLPLFSGAWFRIPIFLVIYGIFVLFLLRYARKVERNPEDSPVYEDDKTERLKYKDLEMVAISGVDQPPKKAITWFLIFIVLVLLILVSGPFIPSLSDYALPLVGLLFLIGGLGAGFLSRTDKAIVLKSLWEGITGIAPGIILILMAVSVNYIVMQGGVMDTILHTAATSFSKANSYAATLIIYVLALFIEFFISSGSAKAFLMMPILLPLADLVGITRQLTVTAYCFGDGFSNLVYPTSPVLLISLGLTVVSYPKWVRWTAKLWFWVILATIMFLGIGVAINFGPF